jgi:hypothetical protein
MDRLASFLIVVGLLISLGGCCCGGPGYLIYLYSTDTEFHENERRERERSVPSPIESDREDMHVDGQHHRRSVVVRDSEVGLVSTDAIRLTEVDE